MGIDPLIKLCRLNQLHEQVITKQRRRDGCNDHIAVHTFPVIDGVLCNFKSHATNVHMANCYYILCKEMCFESFYGVKGEKQNIDGPN